MSLNEFKLKDNLGLSDDKLEKIYNAYSSGKMSEQEKFDFENDFPQFIQNRKAYDEKVSVASNDLTGTMMDSVGNKPMLNDVLSVVNPEDFSKWESAYKSDKMDGQQKAEYENDRKQFIKSHGAGADAKVRLAVGAETDPERRMAVVKKYHPEAVQFGEDNYIIKKDGKNQLFNPEGLDVRDIAGAAPEIVGGAAGTAAAIGSGGTLAAIGGSAVADAGGKRLTQEALRMILGNNDIESIKPEEFSSKVKEVATDTALGVGGGLLGHGISKVAGAGLEALNSKILRPMDATKAKVIINEIDNASPEIKTLLEKDGLLLSTAYPAMAKIEGGLAKFPVVGGGIQDAQKTGGLLLTDSIENAAMRKAGITEADLTGTNIATRSAGLKDDIKEIRNSNYEDTLKSLTDNSKNERIPLSETYDTINEYLKKYEDVGLDDKKLKQLKNLMGGFDFDSNPAPMYDFLESEAKTLRGRINNGLISQDKKAIAKDLLASMEKDLNAIVPEDALMRKDYAEKSGALDMLKMRGGNASANSAQSLVAAEELATSPNFFNTNYNKLLQGRSRIGNGESIFSPTRTADELKNSKELSDVLARAGLYENNSNTANSALLGNMLLNLVGGKLGGGLLGAGAYGYAGGNNRTFGETLIDTGKGFGGGLVAAHLAKTALKNQAINAIRRSANPSKALEDIIKSSNGGLLDRALIGLGTIASEESND